MQEQWLQSILILQDRDVRCDNIEKQLAYIPDEIAKDEASIKEEENKLKEKAEEIKLAEVQHREIEGEIESLEEAMVKYKTQQMEVKKNEEYTALEHEITTIKSKIDHLENEVLTLMEQQDTLKLEYDRQKASTDTRINSYLKHIESLKDGEKNFKAELSSAQEAVKEAQKDVDPGLLNEYLEVKKQVNRPPYIVPMNESKCSGCHLKVSGEVDSMVRKRSEVVHCDSCGRILYLESL